MMSQIDFIIAISMMFFIMSFSLFYVNGMFSSEIDHEENIRMEKSADVLEKQIVYNNDLFDELTVLECGFKEVGGYQHTESVHLYSPSMVDPNVYNKKMNQISSDYDSNDTLIFDLSFSSGERKIVDVIYGGDSSSTLLFYGTKNITSIMIKRNVKVLSEAKLAEFASRNYSDIRDDFNTQQYFRIEIGDYIIGPEAPNATVIVRNTPVLFADNDGLVEEIMVKLVVW